MSKYLKVTVLLVLGVSFLGADDFSIPTSSGTIDLREIKAKVNSEEKNYNYVVTHNAYESERIMEERGNNIGLSIENNNHGDVINVVKLHKYNDKDKYLADREKYLHHSSSDYEMNLGIEHKGNASHTNMTNIVEISDSEIEESVNAGISMSDDDLMGASIYSETTIENSSINDD